jgi:hypothetical protein
MISLTHQSFLGFDYNFHAIRDETNELFCAYREMFEVAISQGRFFRTMLDIYLPYLSAHFVSMSIHVASPIETFVGLSQIKPRVLYNDVKGSFVALPVDWLRKRSARSWKEKGAI